jgi:hypothetical protein
LSYLRVAKPSPVTESDDLLIFDSQPRQNRQDLGHATLIVQAINRILREIIDLDVR